MVATLDHFVQRLGDPGRYQVFVLLLIATNVFPDAFNPTLLSLFAVEPKHHCKLDDNSTLNDSIPTTVENGRLLSDSCHMYANPSNHNNGVVGCKHGWEYVGRKKESSIVGEWDLVCSYHSLAMLPTSLYFLGMTLGGPISGFLADRFGRKPVMMGSLFLQALLGVGLVFSDSLATYVALRTLQGAFVQGLTIASYTIVFEIFSQKYRSLVVIAVTSLASLAIIISSLIAFAVGSWRYAQLAVTLPSIVGLTYFWLIPESLRWLITHKKLQQAEDVAEFYARYNQMSLPATLPHEIDWISRQLPLSAKADCKSDPRQLLKTSKLRKYSLIQFYTWFTMALASQSTIDMIPQFGSNLHFSFMTLGGVALSSRLLLIFILPKFGRRVLQCLCCIISGLLCLTAAILHNYADGSLSIMSAAVGCALFGMAFVSACFVCLQVYTAELYPTVIRSMGTGSCAFWKGFGDILAPFLILLGKHTWRPFPAIFVAIVTFGAGLLTLLLPETLKIPLPDTVEDAENIETIYSTRPRGRSFRKVITETVT